MEIKTCTFLFLYCLVLSGKFVQFSEPGQVFQVGFLSRSNGGGSFEGNI